jgi:hypothetical protein
MDPKRSGKRDSQAWQNPKVVGQARNEHGTRLSQRVVCAKCLRVDYVPVKVALAKDTFCRDCAERLLFAYDQGRHIAEKTVICSCVQCHCDFKMAEALAQKKEQIMCPDCHRGFTVWRGKAISKDNGKHGRLVLTKIGSHTTLRKVIDDAV